MKISDTEIYKIKTTTYGVLYGRIENVGYMPQTKEFTLGFVDFDRGLSGNIPISDVEKFEIADLSEYMLYNQKWTAEKVYNAYIKHNSKE